MYKSLEPVIRHRMREYERRRPPRRVSISGSAVCPVPTGIGFLSITHRGRGPWLGAIALLLFGLSPYLLGWSVAMARKIADAAKAIVEQANQMFCQNPRSYTGT